MHLFRKAIPRQFESIATFNGAIPVFLGQFLERGLYALRVLSPVAGFSVRKSAFSPSTARKMAKPMPIGSNQSRAGIGAEWNHTFKKGTYTNNTCSTASTPTAIQTTRLVNSKSSRKLDSRRKRLLNK